MINAGDKIHKACKGGAEPLPYDRHPKGWRFLYTRRARFAGSSSVPAHVEMMRLIGAGNNPGPR